MQKRFTDFGARIDADYASHAARCAQCARAGARPLPAELAGLCLEGAVLWKREHEAVRPKRARPKADAGDNFRCSRAKAQAGMRYK